MCLMKGMDRVSFDTDPAGRLCKQKRQNHQVCDNTDLAVEINRRVLQGNPVRLRRYDLALNDQSTELLRLRVRMPKAEVMETMPYGCVTRSPTVAHLATLRTLTTDCSSDASDGRETSRRSSHAILRRRARQDWL